MPEQKLNLEKIPQLNYQLILGKMIGISTEPKPRG
jgi:hypothetical protein